MTGLNLNPEYYKATSYGRNYSQWTGNPAMPQQWLDEHGFDEYGQITGPGGTVPYPIALEVQAAHERAVMQSRNRMGEDANRYLQGSLGLLSSYRPGGAAALQSGIHSQLAQVQLQRAQLNQPLDQLSDLRRRYQRKANEKSKGSVFGQVMQGLGAAAMFIPGGQGIGLGLMAGGSVLQGQPGQAAQYGMTFANMQGGGAAPQAGAGQQMYGQPIGPMPSTASPSYMERMPEQGFGQGTAGLPGQIGPQPEGAPGSARSGGGGPGAGAGAPRSAGPAGGAPGAPGAAPGAGPGAGAAGGGAGEMMGPPPPVGADGNFGPMAYAARSVSQGGRTSFAVDHAMTMAAAERAGDGWVDGYTAAIDRQMELRMRSYVA